jgi:catechol 2,3-dioxygenase-like lactoylglutathione lyase family enzyme
LNEHGLNGLAGVLVWTSPERFPAMDAFYVDVLGLTPRTRRDGFVNFEFGDQRLTVAVHDEVAGPARDPRRIMVNLAVDDAVAVHALLVARGVTFLREPEREAWGGTIASFTDPDGNILQLLQPR